MIGIYKIECKLCKNSNGIYIGKSMDIEHRWYRHKIELNNNKHINKHLQNAWNKYGEKNFTFDILEICDEDILSEKEIFYIDKYNSYKKGFNRTLGGEGSSREWTNEEKHNHSINRIGNKNPYYGKHHTKEWHNMIIEKSKEATSKSIVQLDINNLELIKVYKSISEASREMNISIQAISRCLNNKSKSCCGFIWKYKIDYDNNVYIKPYSNVKKKKVCKIDINTNQTIKIYESIADACYDNFGDRRKHSVDISNCCNNKQKTAYGFIWKYL